MSATKSSASWEQLQDPFFPLSLYPRHLHTPWRIADAQWNLWSERMLWDDSLDSREDNGLFWLPKAHKNITNPSSLHQPFQLPLDFSETLPRQISHKAAVWCECIINLLLPTRKYDLNTLQYGQSMWQVFIPCPQHLHCNFTIQKPPVIGRGWKHLDVANSLDRLSIPSPSKSMHKKWEFLERQKEWLAAEHTV